MTEYEKLLKQLINQNENIVLVTAENKAALRELPEELEKNFVDVGIAEQSMIGISAGMALRNKIPVAHALAAFLTMRAYEFIRTDLAYPKLPVKLVGSFAGFLSNANGPTHQAIEDVGIMASIPNMSVFCPADYDDMLKCLPEIIGHKGPVYIRFNDLPAATEHSGYEFGKAEKVYDGDDVLILAYGAIFKQAYDAVEILKEQGIEPGLINLRTVQPLDMELIMDSVTNAKLVVTLEDHFIHNGLYSMICKEFFERSVSLPVLPIGLEGRWFKPLLYDDVLAYEGFTAEDIAFKISDKFKNLNR